MKTLKVTFLSIFLFVSVQSWSQVDFIKDDLSKALEKAKAERKYIMVDVYADWCGWCKKMEMTTFKNEEVAHFVNNHMVALKLNSEQGDGVEFARKFQVTGLPTIVYLDYKGNLVRTAPGYKTASDLMKDLSPYKSKQRNINLASYFEKRQDYISFLKSQLDLDDAFGVEAKQALIFGEENKAFEFDQYKASLTNATVTDISKLDLFYLVGKDKTEQAQAKLKEDKLVGEFSKYQSSFLVLYFMEYGAKEIEVLQMANELSLKSKDVNVLETKAAAQYFMGDLEDAKKTLKTIEKQNKKQKLNKNESFIILKNLIYQ